MMSYTVVILQDGEYARLECTSLEEAHRVRRSFVNYGRCQAVSIEQSETPFEYPPLEPLTSAGGFYDVGNMTDDEIRRAGHE